MVTRLRNRDTALLCGHQSKNNAIPCHDTGYDTQDTYIQKEKKKTEHQETNQRDQGKGKSVEKYVAPPTGDATRQFKISELKKQHHLVQRQHYIV